ncbi:hypothetical protein AMTR_s00143p00013640, partial [Amborella trichopoda]
MQTENPSNAIVDPQEVQTMVAMDGSIEEELMIPPLNVFSAENLELISSKDDKFSHLMVMNMRILKVILGDMRVTFNALNGQRAKEEEEAKVGDKVIETPAKKRKAKGKGTAKSIPKPTRSSPRLAPQKMDQGGGGLIILSDDS